jgi:DNA-directed RNA polymerase specialized sigma24 family protein
MRIMSYQRPIRTGKDSANEYATREDFCRVFTENLNGLYQLSYLLTGDDEKAQQCFVAGLEQSVKANHVFKDWARSWAKRAIIKNAIRALQPQAADSDSSLPASVVSEKNKLRIIRDGHLEIDSVLALEDFERFVFVMTVLERYSDHDSALLIGCSIAEIRAARICALEEIAVLACTDSSWEVPVGCGPHQLPLITNTPP